MIGEPGKQGPPGSPVSITTGQQFKTNCLGHFLLNGEHLKTTIQVFVFIKVSLFDYFLNTNTLFYRLSFLMTELKS